MCKTTYISALSCLINTGDPAIVKVVVKRSDGEYKEIIIRSASKREADKVRSLLSSIEDFRTDKE